MKLDGSYGTGETVLNNKNNLRNLSISKDNECIIFEIEFGNQRGSIVIRINNGNVVAVTFNCCDFPRPLSQNNDPTLFDLANYLLKNHSIFI